jgi:dienelactone hydrolase
MTRPATAFVAIVAITAALAAAPRAQTPAASAAPPGTTLEATVPPGANFDKANFKFWYPSDVAHLRGVAVLVPGSNGDGRSQADEIVWQNFAARLQLALVGCQFTDKPHDQNFIEDYVNVSKGSGQALLDALGTFAEKSQHPEVAGAPLLLWGMSAGGQFNYEFVAWKPERVIAFVVNKGGIYYSALLSKTARAVPGILFIGGKDLWSRIDTITGLFAVNRRGGANWALAEEPTAGHIVGKSRDVALLLYEDVLALRVDPHSAALKPIADKSGFVGDLTTKTFAPAATAPSTAGPSAWFPSERVARAWLAMVTEKPIGSGHD